ncbi:acyl-CoA/acyl-ACP dehydrogenase [Kineosporia sp. J2-2]|uniref:Acyl-CoA/acyl-ACP dehydrogenase n=1 Tax=Kineosporia corallincola TaxID=2835133 RepID=A0ABS5TP85_9ACTN|nr:acyl-CoA dehydrogenase family protein [Kineosporia corallincola]MBT0772184.1 acyl-CoA/acyl-ACP dehydrogenase [Kineosporia corallincola]
MTDTALAARTGDGETLLPPDLSDAHLAAVTAQLAAGAAENDRTAEFPWAGIQVVHDAGLLRAGIGPAHGGHPLTVVDTVRLFQALGQGDPSVALLTAMTVFQHRAQALAPWWPDELYRRVVADSLTRPVLLNAVRAEPEWGAPARGGLPATTVRKVDGGWILNGRKGFATGSEGLAYHLVWATTSTDPDDDPLLAHAVVPATSAGIEVIRTWDHLGLRATSTHDVVYTDVFVPDENFRGVPLSRQRTDPGGGLGLGIAALYVGVARAAQAWFVTFANERVPTSLGRPIATTERIQSVAGEIEVQLIQAEEVLLGLAARVDADDPAAARKTLAGKLIATRAAVTAVQTAVAALGNPALTRHNPLQRHLRDVLCSRVHPPQDDAALIITGRASLSR